MTADIITFDTNILVYAADRKNPIRHAKALALVKSAVQRRCYLTLQALAEFYHAGTRKKIIPPDEAEEMIDDWMTLFPVICAGSVAFKRAIKGVREHGLSFWDSLLWATAREAGVAIIYSEDFQDGRTLEGVRFVNPFK